MEAKQLDPNDPRLKDHPLIAERNRLADEEHRRMHGNLAEVSITSMMTPATARAAWEKRLRVPSLDELAAGVRDAAAKLRDATTGQKRAAGAADQAHASEGRTLTALESAQSALSQRRSAATAAEHAVTAAARAIAEGRGKPADVDAAVAAQSEAQRAVAAADALVVAHRAAHASAQADAKRADDALVEAERALAAAQIGDARCRAAQAAIEIVNAVGAELVPTLDAFYEAVARLKALHDGGYGPNRNAVELVAPERLDARRLVINALVAAL